MSRRAPFGHSFRRPDSPFRRPQGAERAAVGDHSLITDAKGHWEHAYAERAPDRVSWFEEVPRTSLALIEATGLGTDAAIVDVGGGASHLARELLGRGYRDITVVDISAAALDRARAELPPGARVSLVEADVRNHDFGRRFDVWHDRAAFHFLIDQGDREAYLATLSESLRPGGFMVIATFGPDGPEQCSGLPVRRYGPEQLDQLLGPEFEPVSAEIRMHTTPSGKQQQFQHSLLRRAGYDTVDALLREARAGLDRLQPSEAEAARAGGAVLVDIRSDSQRKRDGAIPGAVPIPRNVLEWRCDPASEHRDDRIARRDRLVIVICDEGYQSSLAAAALGRFGLRATDVIDGFQGWRAAGLPIERAGEPG